MWLCCCLAHVILVFLLRHHSYPRVFPKEKWGEGLVILQLFQVAVLSLLISCLLAPQSWPHSYRPHLFSWQMLWLLCDFWDLFVVLCPLVILWLMQRTGCWICAVSRQVLAAAPTSLLPACLLILCAAQ